MSKTQSNLLRTIPVSSSHLHRSFVFFPVLAICWLMVDILWVTANPASGISIEQDRLIKLSPPAEVTVKMVKQAITVTWTPKGLEIINAYKIFRKEAGQEFNLLAIVSAEAENELNQRKPYRYIDSSAEGSKRYTYAVAVVDHYGNESDLSALAEWLPKR